MKTTEAPALPKKKRIALVAHDNMKKNMLDWAEFNKGTLSLHDLYATGTTGTLLETQLGLSVEKLQSGPLGGDQQIGAKIVNGEIDMVIFFFDPLESQPHDTDIKALLRVAAVWNIPMACSRSSADFMISSPLMKVDYERKIPDYSSHTKRRIEMES